MGKWIKEIFPHDHDYPVAVWTAESHKAGSIWECDCGKQFKLVNEQRDGWFWQEILPSIPTIKSGGCF